MAKSRWKKAITAVDFVAGDKKAMIQRQLAARKSRKKAPPPTIVTILESHRVSDEGLTAAFSQMGPQEVDWSAILKAGDDGGDIDENDLGAFGFGRDRKSIAITNMLSGSAALGGGNGGVSYVPRILSPVYNLRTSHKGHNINTFLTRESFGERTVSFMCGNELWGAGDDGYNSADRENGGKFYLHNR